MGMKATITDDMKMDIEMDIKMDIKMNIKAEAATDVAATSVAGLERLNRICKHPVFLSSLGQIRKLEENRSFCRHELVHLLDVARIAYIENLEKQLHISKEMIYAAAMLHDIGRHLQYTHNIPHDEGSAMIAEEILKDCGFSEAEQKELCAAIRMHRTKETGGQDDLAGLLYRADKQSRMCMFCDAEPECDWSMEKKNMELTV